MNRKGCVTASIHKAKAIILGDFIHEADAPRAEDATFIIQDDSLADIYMLRLLDLVVLEPGGVLSVFHGKFLKSAFTGLVTDGAVERVVDEEKLHDPLAALLYQR